MGCVYQTRNRINGKSYIGKTVKMLAKRRWEHETAAKQGQIGCRLFNCALREHGLEAFEWHMLAESDDEDVLNLLEQRYIRRLNSLSPNGYNLRDGGHGNGKQSEESKARMSATKRALKRRHTEEAKAKMSEASKRNWQSVEYRAKMAMAFKKRSSCSEETKAKIAAKSKGNKYRLGTHQTKETKAKIGAANRGKHRSEETKVKMGRSQKLRWQREAQTKEQLFTFKGRQHSEESKAKNAEAQKGNRHRLGKPCSEEAKARIKAASKRNWESEEYRVKVCKAIREANARRKREKEIHLAKLEI